MTDYSVLADEIERLSDLWTHASSARLKAIAAELREESAPVPHETPASEPLADNHPAFEIGVL